MSDLADYWEKRARRAEEALLRVGTVPDAWLRMRSDTKVSVSLADSNIPRLHFRIADLREMDACLRAAVIDDRVLAEAPEMSSAQ